ncbi:MAG: chemotaxis protein CheX [Oligoflexia bacterium]|nr:chemotaxis protein CheX [Oligoflexia bacterium]
MEKLIQIARDVSLDRFSSHMGAQSAIIQDTEDGCINKIRSFHTSTIIISGKDIRMTFKIHFDSDTAIYFASRCFKKDPTDYPQTKAIDFFKEYVNLVAGRIKKIFHGQNIPVGISLPIVTRGFDEIFFSGADKSDEYISNTWGIKENEEIVYCTCVVDSFNKQMVKELKYPEENQKTTGAEEGEVNFL